jgi:hypothetical protein
VVGIRVHQGNGEETECVGVALGAFSFLPALLICAKTGTTALARTARLDSHILNFRIDSLTLDLRIVLFRLGTGLGAEHGQSHFHLEPLLEYSSRSNGID